MNFEKQIFPGDGILRSLITIKNKIRHNFVPCSTPANPSWHNLVLHTIYDWMKNLQSTESTSALIR